MFFQVIGPQVLANMVNECHAVCESLGLNYEF